MDAWQTVATAVLGNAVVLGVLGWLGRSLLEKILLRDSKRFELELQAKSQATIEQLKSELQLRAIEHQVSFSRLHEKRASVIAEMNSLLAETLWEAENVLSVVRWAGEPSEREKHRSAEKKLVEFFRYFDKHRIYLPVALCGALEKLVLEVREHVIGYGVYLTWDEDTLQDHTREEKHKTLMKGYELLKKKVPEVRQQLEGRVPCSSWPKQLTLRCTRSATAGFARFRTRVSSNVRPHEVAAPTSSTGT